MEYDTKSENSPVKQIYKMISVSHDYEKSEYIFRTNASMSYFSNLKTNLEQLCRMWQQQLVLTVLGYSSFIFVNKESYLP